MVRLLIASAAVALLAANTSADARRFSDYPNSCYLDGKRYRVCPTLRGGAATPRDGGRPVAPKRR